MFSFFPDNKLECVGKIFLSYVMMKFMSSLSTEIREFNNNVTKHMKSNLFYLFLLCKKSIP